jgi:hypothetical protein
MTLYSQTFSPRSLKLKEKKKKKKRTFEKRTGAMIQKKPGRKVKRKKNKNKRAN